MIKGGLVYKLFHDTWLSTAIFCFGFFTFEVILAGVLPTVGAQASTFLKIPFVRVFLGGLLGVDIGENLSPDMIGAFAWVHPAVLGLIWAQQIMYFTRLPAGEVDRGTFDMLLAMPVSRLQIYTSHTALGLTWGLCLMGAGALGTFLGGLFFGPDAAMSAVYVLRILTNLFCLYLAVSGLALLASALFNRRAAASGLAFALVLSSFLLNFLANMWAPARSFKFLSLLTYYRPMDLISNKSALLNMVTLAIFGGITWALGAYIFRNKDLPG